MRCPRLFPGDLIVITWKCLSDQPTRLWTIVSLDVDPDHGQMLRYFRNDVATLHLMSMKYFKQLFHSGDISCEIIHGK